MLVSTFRPAIVRRARLCGGSLLLWAALLTAGFAQSGATVEYQAYPLKHKAAADVEKLVTQMVAGQSGVHVICDPIKNQLLVRGPQETQQIVRQLLESADQPASQAPALVKPTVKSYSCDPARLAETAESLRAQFAGRPEVRVATDPSSGRLLVLAPADIHEALARQFSGNPGPGNPVASAPVAPPSPRPAAPPANPPVQQVVPVANVRADQMALRLRELLGARLETVPNPQTGTVGYRLADEAGRVLEMQLDGPRNALHLVGTPTLVEQVAQLVRVLDNPRPSPEQSVSILHLRSNTRERLRQAVGGTRAGQRSEGGVSAPNPWNVPNQAAPIPTTPEANKSSRNASGGTGIDLVAHLFQPAADAAPGPPEIPGQPGVATPPWTPQNEQELQLQLQRLRQLGEDVEVQTLPDLDVVILRGRQRDVDEMRHIIEEIERISAESQPNIEVYPLQHAGCAGVALVLKEVSSELLGSRQGHVSATPLVKPNALLLIGWGQAFEAVKELLVALDRPVAPGTEFRVFRLAHTPAVAAAGTIRQFLATRKGLGTQAEVVPDARTNSLIVYAAPRDLEEVAALVERLDVGHSDSVNQVRIFPLQNSMAADLAATLEAAIKGNLGGGTTPQKSAALELLTVDTQGAKLLKSGILNDVSITPDVRMNTLVVSAPAESMELLAALVKQLDSPTSVAQIKVFHIVNGDVNALVMMLRSLLPSQIGAAAQLQLAAAEGESALTPLRFSVDLRTNSIIAVGSAGDLAIIEALLLRLDERDVEQRRNTVYRLRNAPANDVAVAVNDFLRNERTLKQAIPGALSPFQRIESEVVVVPEPVSNALIVSATPRYYEEIMKLVNDLDAQPPMVLIQVLIAAVDLRNFTEFGAELGLQDSLLFDRSAVQTSSAAGNTLNPGFNFNNSALGNSAAAGSLAGAGKVAGQGLTNFNLSRVGDTGYGGLVLAASSESVSVLIRALQECRRLEVLARPQIMTLDNQPSYIQVGQRVPRISASTISTVGQSNSIALENVGLIVGVTPRVSPEGIVVMDLDAERSELGDVDEGIPVAFSGNNVIRSPIVNLTQAQTTVSAADGETIVLGGLIDKSTTRIKRRVPWLSNIPVVGNLFRYDSDSVRRDELLIILTPHIVRNPKDAEEAKQIEAARMHWCLADVHDIHGEAGLRGTQVIYPDVDPRGTKGTTVASGQSGSQELELLPVPERVPTPTPVLPKIDFPAAGPTENPLRDSQGNPVNQ